MLSLVQIALASKSASVAPSFCRAHPRHHRFITVLQQILENSSQPNVEHNLTPATCIHLVNTLSTACYLQSFDSGHAQYNAFVDALRVVFESHVSHTNDNTNCPTLFFLAVCAALLRFLNISSNLSARPLHSSCALRNLIIPFVRQALGAFEQPLSTLAHKQPITFFDASHAPSISLIFIISSISSIAVKHLSSTHFQLIRRSIQTCMQTTLHKHHSKPNRTATSTDATFHHQVCRTIAKHTTTLAIAYANFIQQQRCFQTSVHFITALLSTSPSSKSLPRFIYTVIANTNFTPDIAVAYASILSLISTDNPILQRAVIHRLSSLVADDDDATKAVVQLICIILVNRLSSADTNRRLVFLCRFLALVMTIQSTRTASVQSSSHVLSEEMEQLWAIFAKQMVRLVDGDPKSEPILSATIQCLSQLVKQEDISTKLATNYLRETFTKVLIENYLFRDISITMRKRLIHVVLFLDAIATTTNDAQIFEAFLTTLIQSAEKVGNKADRMVGILVLRCLTRCDEKVVSVALDKMTSFIGTNRYRKETFLPLVRAAVLGLDTAKKDVCVVWMMRLFGDMKQQQCQRTRPTAAVRTNIRAAKL